MAKTSLYWHQKTQFILMLFWTFWNLWGGEKISLRELQLSRTAIIKITIGFISWICPCILYFKKNQISFLGTYQVSERKLTEDDLFSGVMNKSTNYYPKNITWFFFVFKNPNNIHKFNQWASSDLHFDVLLFQSFEVFKKQKPIWRI